MKYLVTGSAGFIGFHLTQKLIASGHTVVGVDNMNSYYETSLKRDRNAILLNLTGYSFYEKDLSDLDFLMRLFEAEKFDYVVNLAAQAGVRYSIDNPHAYVKSNLEGFLNILEACRAHTPRHLVYASSSSVYGANDKTPFSESDFVDNPVSLYAATKKSNELMAHCYSHLFSIPASGLRFFTVYGPWGRPDMAYFKFAKMITEGKTIDIYNNGDMMRDFTYIDDIVAGIIAVCDNVPQPKNGKAACDVFNIGNHNPVKLGDFVAALEKNLGIEADKRYLPMQPGDVYATYADIAKLSTATGWKPTTNIDEGLSKFVSWFKGYYRK